MSLKNSHKFYWSAENTALSVSKVKDFLISKSYFKARWLDRLVPDDLTPSMCIGSAVDVAWSEGSVSAIDSIATTDKKDTSGKVIMRESDMLKAKTMATGLLSAEFNDWYKDKECERQFPLYGKTKEGYDICGLPDCVTYEGGTAWIDDLKCVRASAMKNVKTIYWHALESGWFTQLAVYSELIRQNHPEIRKVNTRLILISNSEEGMIHRMILVEVPKKLLQGEYKKFCQWVKKINEEKDWKDEPVIWRKALKLKKPARNITEDDLEI